MDNSGGIQEKVGEPEGVGRYIRPTTRKLSDAPGRFVTVATVYKITRSIKEANAKKTKKIMIFVDFEQAFDSLIHKTMFATLRNSGCPDEDSIVLILSAGNLIPTGGIITGY